MSNKPIPAIDANSTVFSRHLPLLMILAVLVTLIVYLKWPEGTAAQNTFKRVVTVKMIPVVLTEFIESVEAVGSAIANEQVLITSKYAGFIEELYFEDGQIVKKSAVLVQLHNQEERAKVSELTANLSESQAHLKRLTELLATRSTSISAAEQQTSKTKAIAAQLVSAIAKLDDLTIRAPFAGVLGFREVSKGAYIDSGDVLTSLDDLSQIKVNFYLPERLLTQIQVGQQISAVTAAYQDAEFVGQITAIDSRIDRSTRSIKVRAIISNKKQRLHPGMMLNIKVLMQVEKILQLPESSIISIEKKHYVFVVKDSIAVRKTITLGRRHPGIVEVISGLAEGDQVVVEGALKLRDGTAVNIIESATVAG
ncbi:MAG: efflux RND transporter periplasmic adaptor subunit [Colwellia sp.]